MMVLMLRETFRYGLICIDNIPVSQRNQIGLQAAIFMLLIVIKARNMPSLALVEMKTETFGESILRALVFALYLSAWCET